MSVADIVAALGRVAGAEAAARVRIEPKADIQRVVDGWPTEFITEARLLPPLEPDADDDSILRAYLEDHGS